MLEIPIQVSGKLRGKIEVAIDATPAEILTAAKADERVQAWLGGKEIVKEVVVPGRLVNFVVR